MKKFISLSQKVLAAKEKRRVKIFDLVAKVIFITVSLACCIFGAHYTYKQWKEVHAPNWAYFQVNSPTIYESVQSINEDGVPNRLSINGSLWEVVKVSAFDDAKGHEGSETFSGIQAQTYCEKNVIAYVQTNDPKVLRSNLWHEIFHAGACIHGGDAYWNSINPTMNVHEGIKNLGEFTSSFTRANPDFLIWLMK